MRIWYVYFSSHTRVRAIPLKQIRDYSAPCACIIVQDALRIVHELKKKLASRDVHSTATISYVSIMTEKNMLFIWETLN